MNTHGFKATTMTGEQLALSEYAGQVLLIVNVASKCGLTPQYAGLEALQRELGGDGLQVLGFPCNQFGGQEPGTDADIQEFCSTNYDVTFPIFAKIDVNGPDADPLFTYLRAQQPGDFSPTHGQLFDFIKSSKPETIGTDEVKWNFTKFLVGRDGEVLARFEPTVTPEELRADVRTVLTA